MSLPAKLIFRPWKKPEVTYELHGWRPEESLAFAIDDKGHPQVMEFLLPAQFNEVDRPTPAFPQSAPTEVTEIRLVPPPCCADRAEAHGLRVLAKESAHVPGSGFGIQNWDSAWELERLRYDSEILTLGPEDNPALTKLLEEFKVDKRREYAAKKQELHELMELIRHKQPTVGRSRYYAHVVQVFCAASMPGVAEGQLFILDQERITLEGDYVYPHGFLNWTLDDVRRHHEIRDPYLQSKWAKENGFNLEQMHDERRQASAWVSSAASGGSVSQSCKQVLGADFDPVGFPTAPFPAMLDFMKAQDVRFGASIRFRVMFTEGSRAWLTACPKREPETSERIEFGAAQGKVVTLETIKDGQGQVLTKLESVDQKTEQVLSGVQTLTGLAGEQATSPLARERERLEAVVGQLDNKTKVLADTIDPLNKLYSEVELGEIRKRAVGKRVPGPIVDWVLMEFMKSNPPKLPTKGDVFNNCGPGTLIGKKLAQAGCGISKQRFAEHLTVMRRLLEQKGWLASRVGGKSRKRESNVHPDERFEDMNQPTPAESAEDRDEERRATGSEVEEE